MFKPGLRQEIVFTLTIVMMAASFLIGIVVMSITKKSIVDQKVINANTLINFLQHSIDSICYGNDEIFKRGENNWQLQRLVSLFTLEKEVENIFIIDRKGQIIASSKPNQIGSNFQDNDLQEVITNPKILARLPKAKGGSSWQGNDELSVSAPIYLKNKVVGAIRMTLSLKDIQETINKAYKLIIIYIIFNSIIIILFGSFLLSRAIVRPIQKLVKATESIARGDYDQCLIEGTRNEIGQLSFAFNRMAERIKEHQEQLQTQIESLEKLNQQLQESQREVLAGEKLALVGKLAAGVAHEIGNPLSAILGYISLLQKKQNQDNIAADYLRRIEQELNRINKTIRGLLDFSRLQKVEITSVDMKRVIENSLALIVHQKSFKEINLYIEIEKELWPVEGDEHQFQQVLLNLLLNAGDAVGGKGVIGILADRMIWQEGLLTSVNPSWKPNIFPSVPHFGLGAERIHLEEACNYPENQKIVRILVADNGEGIEAENLKRIFDPFFTTREPGKGTGLGLAICSRIIESYGGKIIVRSEVKKGSAFLLILPAKGK